MDSLIRKRFGPHVSIFNTSKTPMPEIDSTPVSDGYEVTTDEPISASAMSLCPSVYVDEDSFARISGAPGPEYKKLEDSIKESCVIIVLLTARSAESSWVIWEAQQSPFEPRRYVPVYGAIVAKNHRKLMPKFLGSSGETPTDDGPRRAGSHWTHQTRVGDEIISESIYFDTTKQNALQKLFSKLEESTGLRAVTDIDWAAEAARFERFI